MKMIILIFQPNALAGLYSEIDVYIPGCATNFRTSSFISMHAMTVSLVMANVHGIMT